MIDYIDIMWRDWAVDMRGHYKGWPSENHIWRMYIAQGLSSDDFGPRCPNIQIGYQADVEQMIQVFQTMDDDFQLFAWIFYVKRWGKKRKAKTLDMTITKMYETRSNLHSYTEGRLYKLESELSKFPVLAC